MVPSLIRLPQVGMSVYTADCVKIGEIARLGPECAIIEKGWLLPDEISIPHSAVANVEGDEVVLNLTKDAIEKVDWATPPTTDADQSDLDRRMSNGSPSAPR